LSALKLGLSLFGGGLEPLEGKTFVVDYPPTRVSKGLMTLDRGTANGDAKCSLLGFDHPIIQHMTSVLERRDVASRTVAVRAKDDAFMLAVWRVSLFGDKGATSRKVVRLAFSKSGHRLPEKEHLDLLQSLPPIPQSDLKIDEWTNVVDQIPSALEKDLKYRGLLTASTSFQAELIAMMVAV
jgi:hypothetical protein